MTACYRPNTMPRHGQPLDPRDSETLSAAAALRVARLLALRGGAGATPLHALPSLAQKLGLGALHLKDEGQRLGLGSFKALGGAYALMLLVQAEAGRQWGRAVPDDALMSDAVRKVAAGMTFACATDGNHGRSVAQGAQMMGAQAVIFVHSGVSAARMDAIARFGARVVRVKGNYDDSVNEASRVAALKGWTVLSDTSWEGYEDIPALVTQGYTAIPHEVLGALTQPPTHVFLQAGVGGFAAAVAGHLAVLLGKARPHVTIVEPARAACLFESAEQGRPMAIAPGEASIMAMLECYEPSRIAFRVLERVADGFMTLPEEAAPEVMRRLAFPEAGDPPVVAGESGGVGLAGLMAVLQDKALAARIGLGPEARVLVINTEGATDPALYAQIVGQSPEAVLSHARPASHGLEAAMTTWRHDLHRHPEFGFEESRTAAFVAATLRGFGLEVTEGIGGTGVVGTLRRGSSPRAIALRADMDALRITEATGLAHASHHTGLMHACGHDGHTAMLLGAARILAGEGGFDGTVRFVFQPDEEWGKGAQAMLDDGLLQRFPFDEIFGLHNMPGLPVGHLETKPGAFMSAEDNFEISLRGQGGHAARPQWGREVMVPACALVLELQSVVSRRLNPADIAVLSVTELLTDGTRNALPGLARILGDARSFRPEVSALIEAEMRRIAAGVAQSYGVESAVNYTREFVPLVNDAALAAAVLRAAAPVSESTALASEPMTGSEDFARFLAHVPGCFAFIGNGRDSAPLHSPAYDFNDAALLHGARVHVAIARARLTEGGGEGRA